MPAGPDPGEAIARRLGAGAIEVAADQAVPGVGTDVVDAGSRAVVTAGVRSALRV
jgi:hypothetical protein